MDTQFALHYTPDMRMGCSIPPKIWKKLELHQHNCQMIADLKSRVEKISEKLDDIRTHGTPKKEHSGAPCACCGCCGHVTRKEAAREARKEKRQIGSLHSQLQMYQFRLDLLEEENMSVSQDINCGFTLSTFCPLDVNESKVIHVKSGYTTTEKHIDYIKVSDSEDVIHGKVNKIVSVVAGGSSFLSQKFRAHITGKARAVQHQSDKKLLVVSSRSTLGISQVFEEVVIDKSCIETIADNMALGMVPLRSLRPGAVCLLDEGRIYCYSDRLHGQVYAACESRKINRTSEKNEIKVKLIYHLRDFCDIVLPNHQTETLLNDINVLEFFESHNQGDKFNSLRQSWEKMKQPNVSCWCSKQSSTEASMTEAGTHLKQKLVKLLFSYCMDVPLSDEWMASALHCEELTVSVASFSELRRLLSSHERSTNDINREVDRIKRDVMPDCGKFKTDLVRDMDAGEFDVFLVSLDIPNATNEEILSLRRELDELMSVDTPAAEVHKALVLVEGVKASVASLAGPLPKMLRQLDAEIALLSGCHDLTTIEVTVLSKITLGDYVTHLSSPDARLCANGGFHKFSITDEGNRVIVAGEQPFNIEIDQFTLYQVQLPVDIQYLSEVVLGGVFVGFASTKDTSSSYSTKMRRVCTCCFRKNSSERGKNSALGVNVSYQSLGSIPPFKNETCLLSGPDMLTDIFNAHNEDMRQERNVGYPLGFNIKTIRYNGGV